ncbi:MAG: 6-carboxytetrahydropterin synthase QueD [Dehalococcoidia bacterium]|nr:6-carboxytetrahydropterin synthase QueD [Dehalococcoidia bacterium]
MYQITIEQHFDAAHALRGYQGQCENLHGHRFKVLARIQVDKLNNIGLAYDFRTLKTQLNHVLDKFDHTYLNEITPFDRINPSSENIASTIYHELAPNIEGVKLVSIEVWESPESAAEYRPSYNQQSKDIS